MCHFNNAHDMWLQTAVKSLKVQISQSYIWAADVFYYKTCYDRFVYIKKKNTKRKRFA